MLLQSCFDELPDFRRKEGQRYPDIGKVILFSVFAILSGATSYRKIHSFIKIRFDLLKEMFSLSWKQAPGYTTIRNLIKGVSKEELEACFRNYSSSLTGQDSQKHLAFDGKTLKGSLDRFEDQKAVQILSCFCVDEKMIWAHEEIEEKTNEIPMVQKLIKELGLSDCIFTLDAMHCQKKP